jgi:hypothetical protein
MEGPNGPAPIAGPFGPIKFGIQSSIKLPDPKDWVAGFKNHSQDKQARSILIQLAFTPISVSGDKWFEDQQKRN